MEDSGEKESLPESWIIHASVENNEAEPWLLLLLLIWSD